MGLLQGRTGRKQEPRSQDAGNTLPCKHHEVFLPSAWMATSDLSGWKSHLRVLTGAGREQDNDKAA